MTAARPDSPAWEAVLAYREWLWATLPDLATHADVHLGSEGTALVIRVTLDRAAPPEAVALAGQVHEVFRGWPVRVRRAGAR